MASFDQSAPVRTAEELRARNAASGGHFFDPDAMRFFGSRLLDGVYPAAGGARTYFVTSEADRGPYPAWDGERRYTVRVIVWASGQVDSPDHPNGEFGYFSTAATARTFARRCAEADTRGAFAWPCPLALHAKYATGDTIATPDGLFCGACAAHAVELDPRPRPTPSELAAKVAALRLLHPAAELTGASPIPEHVPGAYPRLSCCGGPVQLVEAVQR